MQQARAAGSDDDATLQLLRIDELPDDETLHARLRRENLALPPVLAPGMLFEGFRIARELQDRGTQHVHLAVDEASGQQLVENPSSIYAATRPISTALPFEEWVARRVDSHSDVARPGTAIAHAYALAVGWNTSTARPRTVDDRPPAAPSLDAVRSIVEQLPLGLRRCTGVKCCTVISAPKRHDRPQRHRPHHRLATVYVAGPAEAPGAHGQKQRRAPLHYIAPECLLGHEANIQADLFALAAMSYQIK